jgi:hypothetical protein
MILNPKEQIKLPNNHKIIISQFKKNHHLKIKTIKSKNKITQISLKN